MKISLRIFLGYFLIVGLAAYFVLQVFVNEVKPGVRQSMESSLVDTANTLAQLAVSDMRNGSIATGQFSQAIKAVDALPSSAEISGVSKKSFHYRVTVTDHLGTVVYDSRGRDVGKDYSKWNDVYLTLRGKYGARSTRDNPNDDRSSVMYVAAPIKHNNKIIGVLTVSNPNLSVQPYIEQSQKKILRQGGILLALSFAVGLLASYWLSRSISRLTRYASAVASGQAAVLPDLGKNEIGDLGKTLETMRRQLDGKHYVEQYVQTLTHEMKSPLSAIRGAAEILQDNPNDVDRERFTTNIQQQSQRLADLIDKTLALASVEYRQNENKRVMLDMIPVCLELQHYYQQSRNPKNSLIDFDFHVISANVLGDAFLLKQAIQNLIENAIDFSHANGKIHVQLSETTAHYEISVRDWGVGIPDYAQERLFERFYSLPRPESGQRSSGLGLSFVQEVAQLHQGRIQLENQTDGGVKAVFSLPKG
jgi:two-component system, OmpR family, sensor histidine kinase CreC